MGAWKLSRRVKCALSRRRRGTVALPVSLSIEGVPCRRLPPTAAGSCRSGGGPVRWRSGARAASRVGYEPEPDDGVAVGGDVPVASLAPACTATVGPGAAAHGAERAKLVVPVEAPGAHVSRHVADSVGGDVAGVGADRH